MSVNLYTYRAVVLRVVDGDTLDLDADLGFRTWRRALFRLAGCNARELSQPGGPEARDHLHGLLLGGPGGSTVTLTSVKPDKYSERYDAVVSMPGGTNLVSVLIAGGWAAPWDGRGSAPLPVWPRATDGTT